MERTFARDIHQLEHVFDFVDEFAEERITNESLVFVVKVAIEEIFSNMVRHNSESEHDIEVGLELNDRTICITLIDRDSEDFDPRRFKDVDVRADLQHRKPGGLGIHLVRHMMDKVEYQYTDRTSVIKLSKRMEDRDA
jgi:anti-sigma regulatory factor (Ser/Thr protein kinase)